MQVVKPLRFEHLNGNMVQNSSPTVVCISLETHSVAKHVSVAVGWDKIKILLMAQLKGLTAKFKLM